MRVKKLNRTQPGTEPQESDDDAASGSWMQDSIDIAEATPQCARAAGI
jgi:hypothetical protein